MKKLSLFALVATMFVACATDATQDLAPEIPTAPDELHVTFDEDDTRIQLQNGTTVWTAGDLVSVFYRSDAHDKYEFQGETGDASGILKRVSKGTPTIGLDKVVAVCPYNENYLIELLTGNIQAFLPAEQTYAEDSFGIGSSIMISSSRTDKVYLKNVCGWLKLQFIGNKSIRKIVLKGNNGEQLAGNIYITADDASCTLASNLTGADGTSSGDLAGSLVDTNTIITELTLNCPTPVALNPDTPTAFYIALPPQTFKNGFTIVVYGSYGYFEEISTAKSIAIERNHIHPMACNNITFEGAPYEIGDLIDYDGAKGVVFYVDDSVVKIVSVSETKATWGPYRTTTNAKDEDNGMNNMNTIKALDADLSDYPAFKWCAEYGADWYLPARNELQTIYNNRSTINSTLSANGYTTLGTSYYWSSTESNNVNASRLDFANGSWYAYSDKTNARSVCAVFAF